MSSSLSSYLSSYGSSPRWLSQADIDSLQNLSKILETGHLCIDVDSQGHVGVPYAESVLSSAWRVLSRSSGNDIGNIQKLVDRVNLAYRMAHEDHSEKLLKALAGLNILKSKYIVQGGRDEVVQKIGEVITKAEQVLKNIKAEPPQKKEHKSKPKTREVEKFSKFKQLDMEVIGSSGKGEVEFDAAYSFYLQKLAVFSKNHPLTKEQLELIVNCQKAMTLGQELYATASIFNPIYGESLIKNIPAEMEKNTLSILIRASEVGILLPSGYTYRIFDKDTRGGHAAPIGIREVNGQFFITQYNIGGGALGDYRVKLASLSDVPYHLRSGQPPLVAKGEAVVTFGPYTQKEVVQFIKQHNEITKNIFENSDAAIKAYTEGFDSSRRLPPSGPARRFQVTGNCLTAGIREFILESFQRQNQIKLFNNFDLYGQERSLDMPSYEEAEEGGRKAENILKLELKEMQSDDQDLEGPWTDFQEKDE